MENRFQNQQPPVFDPNTLDEKFEIVFDYDQNGNLRRIKKVRRHEIGPFFNFLLFVAIVVFLIIIIKNYGA